jgi:rfaE bifunctional protein nucleotidyltransferase chain/domain
MVGHILCEAVDAALLGDEVAVQAGVLGRPLVSGSAKEVDLPHLLAMRASWKQAGLKVAWTNGAFDVLHAGHLASLRGARAFGDVLVVGVNADSAVRAQKGPTRPVFPEAERVEMLGALEVVDHVLVFDEPTPERVLALLQPEVHCKGADYAPPNGAPIPERHVVEAYGGRIEFIPLVADRSTTSVMGRLSKGGL